MLYEISERAIELETARVITLTVQEKETELGLKKICEALG